MSEPDPNDYWELYKLAAPGWHLMEGYSVGPVAEESSGGLRGSTWPEVVWRTWCRDFDLAVYDDATDAWSYPPMPDDWRERIARVSMIHKATIIQGARVLSAMTPEQARTAVEEIERRRDTDPEFSVALDQLLAREPE